MFGIPTSVFILFFVLFYIGIKRCFTRVMPLKRLAVMPVIFIIMGAKSINSLFALNFENAVFLFMGCLMGLSLGYLQVKNKMILADKLKFLIQIPGDISLFVSLMFVFFFEFIIHYAIDAHLAVAKTTAFVSMAIFISGGVIGLTVGRNLVYFYQYVKASHVDLILPLEN